MKKAYTYALNGSWSSNQLKGKGTVQRCKGCNISNFGEIKLFKTLYFFFRMVPTTPALLTPTLINATRMNNVDLGHNSDNY